MYRSSIGVYRRVETLSSAPDSVGLMIKNNLMADLPSRTKSYSDYTGMVVPPCGSFQERFIVSRDAVGPPWMSTEGLGKARSGAKLT